MTLSPDDRDTDVLAPEALARYEVPPAPAGFSARVLDAASQDGRVRRPADLARAPRARRWLGVAAIAIAVAVVISLRSRRSSDVSGARTTEARETIALDSRGVVVAERGTELRWIVRSDGDAVVEQPTGTAFYRVERGAPFEVHTPLGVVVVTGTCFSVEVIMRNPMKNDLVKGAALGAAIATAVVVVVYEGGVSVANPSGSIRIVAGDEGVLQPGAPPRTRPGALAPEARDLTDARARIAVLEAELKRSHADKPTAPARTAPDPGRYYAPSAETLRAMADTCWIAFDQPPLDTTKPPILVDDEISGEVGLTDTERDAVNRAYRGVHDRAVDELRRLYLEATGQDTDAAATLSIRALAAEIQDKSTAEQELEARRHLSREHAGLEPSPGPDALARRPVVERYLRIMTELGDEAEAAAAKIVGSARARELRSRDRAGWRNTVSDYGGCELGSGPPRRR